MSDLSWYVDSRATKHVTTDPNFLVAKVDYNGTKELHIGNGYGNFIAHTGSFFATSRVNTKHIITPKDMFYVPKITKNLLSVLKFSRDNGVYFKFHPLSCFVKEKRTWTVLLEHKLKQGLYAFDFQIKYNDVLENSSTCMSKLHNSSTYICDSNKLCRSIIDINSIHSKTICLNL